MTDTPTDRLRAHLATRTTMRMLDQEVIETIGHHVHGQHELRVSDITTVLDRLAAAEQVAAAARQVLDAVRELAAIVGYPEPPIPCYRPGMANTVTLTMDQEQAAALAWLLAYESPTGPFGPELVAVRSTLATARQAEPAPDVALAAQDVTRFLDSYAQASNLDPERIYSYWRDGEEATLRVSDLRTLAAAALRGGAA